MRLIDADAAVKLLRNLGSRDYRREKGTIADAMKMLSHDEYTPTIEAEPVKWIPVEEGLPEEDKYVLIWCGSVQVAKIEKGISMAERKAMEDGLIDNPIEHGWRAAEGWTSHRRSEVIRACDEWGNNLVPYHWYADGGLMSWFGQKVTHWMPLPEPPNCEAKMDKEV